MLVRFLSASEAQALLQIEFFVVLLLSRNFPLLPYCVIMPAHFERGQARYCKQTADLNCKQNANLIVNKQLTLQIYNTLKILARAYRLKRLQSG